MSAALTEEQVGTVAAAIKSFGESLDRPHQLAHVLVLAPVIDVLRKPRRPRSRSRRGDFAQTVGLCERMGIEHTVIGAPW